MTVLYMGCLLIYLLLVCLPQGNSVETAALLTAIAFHAVLTAVALSRATASFRGFQATVLFFGAEILLLALWLGICVFPDAPALLFPLTLILMTQIYTMPPQATLPFIGGFAALFLLLSALFKPAGVFYQDLLSTAVALAIAVVAYCTQMGDKLDAFAVRRTFSACAPWTA